MIPSKGYALVPYSSWHLEWLEKHGKALGGWIETDARVKIGLELTFAWTAVYDGTPIACGGLIEVWPGRHAAWSYFNAGTAKHMRYLTRVGRWMMAQRKGRIELTVRKDFAPGLRWAEMIGFEVETETLKGYGPEGEDHTGYVRIN